MSSSWGPPEMQRLFAALEGNQAAMDAFARMNAGALSPAEFFAPENVRAILAAAGTGHARDAATEPGPA